MRWWKKLGNVSGQQTSGDSRISYTRYLGRDYTLSTKYNAVANVPSIQSSEVQQIHDGDNRIQNKISCR